MSMGTSSPNKPALWEHQIEAVAACMQNLHSGQPSMVQIPTGGGKCRIIGEVVKRLPSISILIITTRVDLVAQNREELGEHGVLCASLQANHASHQRVIVGTYHSILGCTDLPAPELIIVDECHMVPEEGSYRDLLDRFPNASLIGLTATPYRGVSHIRECGIDWETVYAVSIGTLIQRKILVPPVSMATNMNAPSNVMAKDDQICREEITPQICAELVASVKRHGRKKIVVFCEDIAHAMQATAALKTLGEGSVHCVHSRVARNVRAQRYEDFKGDTQRTWLVNVGLVAIGVNIPSIDCVALMRDVASFSLLVQMIGRGLRLFEGKQDCLVFDFGSGTSRFGFLDDPEFGPTTEGRGGLMLKACPQCGANVSQQSGICHRCMHAFTDQQGESVRSTALSSHAKAQQLLTTDFIVLTYDSTTTLPGKKGDTYLEHLLLDTFGHHYRSIERGMPVNNDGQLAGAARFKAGEMVLAHLIERSSNLVEVIG